MSDHYLCVHAHFYQPPRGNPFLDDEIPEEDGAQPYHNFNEKVTAECYAPNAALGNFDLMSFNCGSTLARWLERHAPDTYARIIAGDRTHRERWGTGNALAQPAHHTILPLHSYRDKSLQVRWGLMSFEHRFGRRAEGMWLPEMAVDLETLQVLCDHGVQFTILAQAQLRGADQGAGPYRVRLPSGDSIAVFARDDWYSNQLSFNIKAQGGAGRWARNVLAPLRKTYPRLMLIATDGETFGHHHMGEEHFLHWLLAYEAGAVGFEVTTLARDLRDNPPTADVSIYENTAWSCWHGLNRWSAGCECTAGPTDWKPALRLAFDNVAGAIDGAYARQAATLGVDPWRLREDYFRVVLGQVTESEFVRTVEPAADGGAAPGRARLTAAQANDLLRLLAAQFYRQRMYTSCTFFFDDLEQAETRYGLANALAAIRLMEQAGSAGLTEAFRADLAGVRSNRTGATGAQVLDEMIAALPAQARPAASAGAEDSTA
jgi:hypothetical protein